MHMDGHNMQVDMCYLGYVQSKWYVSKMSM